MSKDLQELASIALEASRIAGEIIMPLYNAGVSVELKADRTPVTIADRNAEEAIRAFLQRELPDDGIVGEEFGTVEGKNGNRWILDPIDGTKSFIHHVPLFGTLIALEQNGLPTVGVIGCHAVQETVWGAKGLGAWHNGRPAHVSGTTSMREATVLTTSYSRWKEKHPAGFEILGAKSGLTRAWGDCYGYMLVATGRAEVMLDPDMNLWDVAALFPVITEAGGRITTWAGEDRVGDSSVATNGLLHEEVIGAINTVGPVTPKTDEPRRQPRS